MFLIVGAKVQIILDIAKFSDDFYKILINNVLYVNKR